MIDEQSLEEATARIVAMVRPSRVILFGSYARDDAREGSDVDLLVIEPEVIDRYAEMVRVQEAMGRLGTGVDVLVYSEAEVEERRDWCTSPVYWALREGRTLYVAA